MKFKRGQTIAEYMLLVAAVIVFSAFFMAQGFRESETSLALASARLGLESFSAANPAFKLSYLNYSIDDASRTIVLRPKFHNFTESMPINDGIPNPGSKGANSTAIARAISAIEQAFHPSSPGVFANDRCVNASYYQYCVQPCFGDGANPTNVGGECKA